MINNIQANWVYENHGRLFNQLELLQILGNMLNSHGRAEHTYALLEENGYIAPASYNKGKITAVRVFCPRKNLEEIEKLYCLDKGGLTKKLNMVFEQISMRSRALRVPQKVIDTLVVQNYLVKKGKMVKLGYRSNTFV